jgi:hypothetical protein
MTEDFTTEALLYLLDELEPARRAAFADHLARDPVARAAFKTCADAYAQFACETAPAESLPAAEQRAMLAAMHAQVAPDVAERRARARPARRWRYVWPLAAAVLLGLNLVQYWRSASAEVDREREGPARGGVAMDGSRRVDPRQEGGADPKSAHGGTTPAAGVADERHRLQKLRGDYAALQRSRDALGAEYDRIIRQLAQRALVEQGVGRLAAMELVDSASYEKGERKGLMNLARRFLTEPGIVAVEPISPPPSPLTPAPPTEPPDSAVTDPAAVTGNATMAVSAATGLQSSAVATGVPGTIQPEPPPVSTPQTPPQPQTSSGPTAAGGALPYAWSVFDETERQGYLNLYNLPTVAADQTLQLWVKPADSTEYQRVGEVPAQFYGGSGSLYYKLPDSSATPAEILVTQEKRDVPVKKPTGPTVLRGP